MTESNTAVDQEKVGHVEANLQAEQGDQGAENVTPCWNNEQVRAIQRFSVVLSSL